MATFDYARARSTAERLIARFGQSGTIRRYTPVGGESYDPEAFIPDDFACTLVDLDYDERQIDGTLIMRGDRMVYMSTAGLTIRPELSDKIVIAGTEHAIKNIMPLSPGGVDVMFQLQARK
jgi:hypothetical protein